MDIGRYIKKKNITLANWHSLVACFLLTIIIFAVFGKLTQTFYQQDEWLGYGLYLANNTGLILQNTGGFWGIVFGQGRILTNSLYYFFYNYFPLNVFPIAIFAIIFHTINTFLVFNLSRKIFKNIVPALLGSLFFAVNSVSQSAITWPAASLNTLPSTTLILIALIFYFRYIEKFKKKWLFYSFILIYISLFFKESGVFLFLLLPIFLLYYKKQNITLFLKTYWYFFVTTLLIVLFRIIGFRSMSGSVALFLTGSSDYFLDSIIVRSFLYPLTSFSLTIIPPEPFLNFARYVTNVYYSFIPESQFILVAQTMVLDLLSTFLSLVVGFIFYRLLRITTPKIRKMVFFWIVFLVISFLPYVIISKNYSYLESRYYYLASAAWGIIFAWISNLLLNKAKSKYVKIIFLVIFALFLFIHSKYVVTGINKQIGESKIRVKVLDQISTIKPRLDNKKNLFYVAGDLDYYLPGNKVPFQQGFGYTLLAWYKRGSKYPASILNDVTLFEIGKEGYLEFGDYGFGYFSELDSLKDAVKANNLSKDIIIGLYYDSKTETVTDITQTVLSEIAFSLK